MKHNLHLAQILEYKELFGIKDKPTINDLLSKIPREKIIVVAGILNNQYGNAKLDKLNTFFSIYSNNNRMLIKSLLDEYFANNKCDPQQIFWSTAETPMQLIRYAFAFPFNNIIPDNMSNEKAEMLIFKLILLMNEEFTKYKISTRFRNPENMIFLLSVMNNNMNGQNIYIRKERSILQLYMSVEFFKYFITVDKCQPIYKAFLAKHNINSWNEYVRSIFGIISMLEYKSGWIPYDLHNDIDNLISPGILNSISINYDENINFSSDGPSDRSGNTDYKVFRERPLIKMPNGNYYLINWEFMIDRLYNSLYFEMKELHIDENLKNMLPGIFTNGFAEKILFNKLIENSASSDKYGLMSEDILKNAYKRKTGELGPPDYLLEGHESYIIFECKDIRIGGNETETHDFDTIIEIYKNKLYWKKWKYVNGVKSYFSENDKADRRIGITQLTGHLSNIRQGKFNYYNTKNNMKIYPVLILSDCKNVHMGFTKIANKWYNESLKSLNENNKLNCPLIIMSFITLIKYKDLFLKHGFEFYFEQYSKLLLETNINKDTVLDSILSFDDFMNRNPFSLNALRKDIMKVIIRDI